jgi:hypothetical protein
LARGLHPSTKNKLRAALAAIVDAPEIGKALKDELAGAFAASCRPGG